MIDLINNYEKCRAYIISFKDNNRLKIYTYVRITRRKLQEKILEHTADMKRVRLSTYVSHLNKDTGIDMLFNKANIIAHV